MSEPLPGPLIGTSPSEVHLYPSMASGVLGTILGGSAS